MIEVASRLSQLITAIDSSVEAASPPFKLERGGCVFLVSFTHICLEWFPEILVEPTSRLLAPSYRMFC